MRIFVQLSYVYLAIAYAVKAFGVLFDGWQLDRWEIIVACFGVVLLAITVFIREGE